MSTVDPLTTELLAKAASVMEDVAAGKSINVFRSFQIPNIQPKDIHEALNRSNINKKVYDHDSLQVGDTMTLSDEISVLASMERAIQSTTMSRVRAMAQQRGRARGLSMPKGKLLFGYPESMTRPEA